MKGVSLIEENTTDAQRTADGYQKTGDIITLPYTEVVSVQQPYATRVENLNPVLTFTWMVFVLLTHLVMNGLK